MNRRVNIKNVQRQLAFIMLIVMAILLNIKDSKVFACDTKDNISHCFLSVDVPETIDDYVKNTFLSYSKDELMIMNITQTEMTKLLLYDAISVYEYDDCDSKYYYYPIVYDNNIIAIITAFETENGEINVQFGRTNLAKQINGIYSCADNPAGLVITSKALYVSFDGCVASKVMDFYKEDSIIKENLLLDKCAFDQYFSKIVEVNSDSISNVICSKNFMLYATNGISSSMLNVPFVPNTASGVCWAASLASIIKYVNVNPTSGITIRDFLVNNVTSYTSYSAGTMECAKDILNYYLSGHSFLCYYNGWGLFNGIMSDIDNNIPVYSDWQGGGLAHAMVICGYYYNSSLPDSTPGARRITVMDPNESNYISINSNMNYNIGTKAYHLYGTVR